jgi:hypothetical protein
MKRFSTFLSEAKAEPTICDLLQLPTVHTIIRAIGRLEHNRTIRSYWNALEGWWLPPSSSIGGIVKKIVEMGNCKRKANWACWSGTGYRGVGVPKSWAKGLEYTGETVTKDGELFLVADGVYTAQYAAQSWTDDFSVANGFAKQSNRIPVVLQAPLTRESTLLSPASSVILGGLAETEIIRVSRSPVPVKVYVNIDHMLSMFWEFGRQKIKPTGVARNAKTQWWTDQIQSLLAQLGSPAVVQQFMGNAKVRAKIKKITGLDV